MNSIRRTFSELSKYPSAVIGLVIITFMVISSIITVIRIPYSEAIRLWRGGEAVWYKNPQFAQPTWTNLFRSKKLAPSLILHTDEPEVAEISEIGVDSQGFNRYLYKIPVNYEYDTYPDDLILYFTSSFVEKKPYVSITWLTPPSSEHPEGREIRIGDFSIGRTQTFRLTQDSRLERRVGRMPVEIGLFADPDSNPQAPVPLQGDYLMQIEGITFEEGSEIDAELVIHGQVSGWAGTDHLRRDIGVALLWGAPVALAFGLLAALGTTVATMIIAAVGVWFSGWLDELIQRITEVNLVIPFLPVLIMVSTFYSRSIWTILGVAVLLSIFGSGIKTYRAIFMQVRESPYVEAAMAYGANNFRIIFTYLIPRIIPLLIPQLVTLIPTYVFLEASLAVLGLGDPVLPTWGKVINDARANGALYQGQYYWILEPAFLLVVTGFAFAMVGFALDRIFNPRLRGV